MPGRYYQFWTEIVYKNAGLHILLIFKSQGYKGSCEGNLFSLSLWCLLFGISEKCYDGLFQIPLCQGIKMRYPINIKAPLKSHCRMQEIIPPNTYWGSVVCFVFHLLTIFYDLESIDAYLLVSLFI